MTLVINMFHEPDPDPEDSDSVQPSFFYRKTVKFGIDRKEISPVDKLNQVANLRMYDAQLCGLMRMTSVISSARAHNHFCIDFEAAQSV